MRRRIPVYGTFEAMHASSKFIVALVSVLALGCSGDDGKIGAVGENGNDGQNGQDGTNVLISTTVEIAGGNCATGGIKLETGVDTNGNDTLDSAEITDTQYICNGDDGGAGGNGNDGLQSLIATTDLPVDGVCVFGGIQVDHGIDDNGDGTLDNGEIDGTSNLCNACPYDPTVFLKDFSAMATTTTVLLDLNQVELTATGGDVALTNGNGVAVSGGGTPVIEAGETLTFAFDAPVFNIGYFVSIAGNTDADGDAGEHEIEAFDGNGSSLGTVTVTETGQKDLSALFSGVAISSFTDSVTADVHNIRDVEFTFCP